MTAVGAVNGPFYARAVTVHRRLGEMPVTTRDTLAERGFGILTELDMQATPKAKLGVDVAPQVIFGECRPSMAPAALQAEPSTC